MSAPDAGAAVLTGPGEQPFPPDPWATPVGDSWEPSPGDAAAPAEGGQSEPGGPVFVDSSGRRGRKLRRLGWLLGSVCACFATVLGVSLAGGHADAPWLLIPGRDESPADSEAGGPSDGRDPEKTRARAGRPPAPALVPGAAPGRAEAAGRGHTPHRGHGARPVVRPRPGVPAEPSAGPKAPAPSPSPTGRGPRPRPGGNPAGTPRPAPSAPPGPSGGPSATPAPTPTPTPDPSAPATHPAPGKEA